MLYAFVGECIRRSSDCYSTLTNIVIPKRVTSIGDSDIAILTNIIIPNSVTSIGTYAFSIAIP